jgi:tetratricopeptide (TPR) repeat protein
VVAICWVVLMGCWIAYKRHQERREAAVQAACRDGEAQLATDSATLASDGYRRAAQYFDEALAINPDCLRALFGKGRACRGLKEWTPAIVAFERAATLAPLHPTPPLGLGELYRAMGLPAKAVEVYLQATKVLPENDAIQRGLASALFENQSWNACIGLVEPRLKRDPADLGARWMLGCSLAELGRENEAREQSRELESRGADYYAREVRARLKNRSGRSP